VRDQPLDPQTTWTSFGPYALARTRATVRWRGATVALDAQGYALLAILIERQGGAVSAAELLELLRPAGLRDARQVWDAVGEVNRVLGAVARDTGHVAHHPSVGYSLVVPAEPAAAAPAAPAARVRRAAPIFGRDAAIQRIAVQVQARRFVTIVGPGGMGKTTVAQRAAEELAAGYADGVCFVDLAPLTEGMLLPGAVAAALGLAATEGTIDLRAYLRGRRMLIVLDSCEHVVVAAAKLVESFFSEAPQVHVLATSREPLRAIGEWVYRLGPIALPPASGSVTAAEAAGSPGIQLFVERARAAEGAFELSDALAPAVVSLCRRLDGIPLAIELAAARAGLLGVHGLAAQVDHRLLRLRGMRRGGPRRHQTIETLLDWSYDLLSPTEQRVLRRLSVFRGAFTLDAAAQVAAGDPVEANDATEALLDLVDKSLVTGAGRGDDPAYRLLDTTRAYVAAKLAADPDHGAARRRHALYMRVLLGGADAAWEQMTRQEWRSTYGGWVNDVRAAMDWALASPESEALGLELTSLSLALADQTSLFTDFAARTRRALDVLRRTPDAPRLLAVRLATQPPYLSIGKNEPLEALSQTSKILGALELAQGIGDPKYQAGPLTALWVSELQMGHYAQALHWSERMRDVAQASGDPVLALIAKRTGAQTHHFLGQHGTAGQLAGEVLANGLIRIPLAYFPSAVDSRVSMRIVLARVLWVQGRAESAARMVEECLRCAEADTPSALCQALTLGAVPVAMWCRDWALARQHLDRLREHLAAYPFAYWRPWWHALEAVHALQTSGPDRPRHAEPVGASTSQMLDDHLPTFEERPPQPVTLERVRRGEADWCAPEVLRVHAMTMRRAGSASAGLDAAALLRQALALARAQGALAWELRAALSLASQWKDEGRFEDAFDLLSGVRARFIEGGPNADLARADRLLREMHGGHGTAD